MKSYNYNYFPLKTAESYESHDSNHALTPSFDYRKVSEASNQSSNGLIPASQTTGPTATPNAKSVITRCAKENTHEQNLQIMAAIKKGNFEELEKFHGAGLTITATINLTFPFWFDPFFHAAMNNNKELFIFLLEKAGTPERIDDFGQLVLMLIENDQLEFIELLEQFNCLSDNYDIDIHDSHRCIPMINIAIITDSPKTIAWLLDKKIDPTIKAKHLYERDYTAWWTHNAFDLAIDKKDLILLHELMIKFAKANGNYIPLKETLWLKKIMICSKMDSIELILNGLKKIQNFSEIAKFLAEEAYKKNKIDFVELLICQYGNELFKNWNIWQQPQEKVFQFLVKISSSSESKISVDHLQTLIKDNVPDLKMISWLLENSFQHLQNEPSCLARSKVRASVLPLIKACVNLGATANAEYMLAFAMGQGNLALFDKSLTTVIESAQRADALKRSKGLLRSVMGLFNSRYEKEKTPSTCIQNKSFQDLITRLCSRAITFEFSENTLTMILSLVDRGADAYCILDRLIEKRCFAKKVYSNDLVLAERLIQKINESENSQYKENFPSILSKIVRANLGELGKLLTLYGTDVTSMAKA